MVLDLEQHLKDLCEQHDPKLDLYDRLERVRKSAETIWDEQRLKWFTDHRAATHSRHVIAHLGSVLEYLQTTPQALTPYELYVLLAACYLHDIGMQDFSDPGGRGVENFTDEDYKRIRKDHPKRARELIIARTLRRERDEFRIDLDDDPQYLVPIALVAQGHGSAFFTDTVRELRDLPHRPGNRPFRGDLLAALLLMGDELDLHEDRATFPLEFALSPVSSLHHHIHHYVTGVEVVDGRTPKHRRIRLITEYPQDSDDYRGEVRQWIVTKLRKQCHLTAPVLESCTQGELTWDDEIEIRETIDRYGVRRSLLDPSRGILALHELRRGLLDRQTVNREEFVEALREALARCRRQFQVVDVLDQDNSDWSHLAKWLGATCDCLRIILVRVAFHLAVGHGSFDVLYRLHEGLTAAGVTCPNYSAQLSSVSERRRDALDTLGQALLTDLAICAEQHSVVLLLERVDKAEDDTARWLENWLLRELRKQNVKILAILTRFDEDAAAKRAPAHWRRFRLVPFTEAQIANHLYSEFGMSPGQARTEAGDMYSLSVGTPLRVLNRFLRMRIQGVRLLQ